MSANTSAAPAYSQTAPQTAADPNAAPPAQSAAAGPDTMTDPNAAPPAETAAAPAPDTMAAAQPAAGAPSADEQQLAQEAGLSGVPMSAQDVCAQRTVTLSDHEGMTRSQKVENAVDRASVCRVQSVVINAPAREAASLKRTIVAQGVPEEAITTQRATASEANVQMSFNGVATSSAQFSALFNPNYAANANSYAPTASDAPGYIPGSNPAPAPTAPQTAAPAPDTQMNDPAIAPEATTAPQHAPENTATPPQVQ
jgi:hypothetical protein